jgi:hypothetical protein
MKWFPASNGVRARHWFVMRKNTDGSVSVLEDKRGNYRWFGSLESAQRAADKANAAH